MKNIIKWLTKNEFKFEVTKWNVGKDIHVDAIMVDNNYIGMYAPKETMEKFNKVRKYIERFQKSYTAEAVGSYTGILILPNEDKINDSSEVAATQEVEENKNNMEVEEMEIITKLINDYNRSIKTWVDYATSINFEGSFEELINYIDNEYDVLLISQVTGKISSCGDETHANYKHGAFKEITKDGYIELIDSEGKIISQLTIEEYDEGECFILDNVITSSDNTELKNNIKVIEKRLNFINEMLNIYIYDGRMRSYYKDLENELKYQYSSLSEIEENKNIEEDKEIDIMTNFKTIKDVDTLKMIEDIQNKGKNIYKLTDDYILFGDPKKCYVLRYFEESLCHNKYIDPIRRKGEHKGRLSKDLNKLLKVIEGREQKQDNEITILSIEDTDKEKLQKFLSLSDKEKLSIVKNALDMTFSNIYYTYDCLSTCYNYIGELFNNEYKGTLNGRRGLYNFKDIFDTKLFYELLEKDLIISNDNYNKIIYDTIYTIVNRMLLKNYFDAEETTTLKMNLQALATKPDPQIEKWNIKLSTAEAQQKQLETLKKIIAKRKNESPSMNLVPVNGYIISKLLQAQGINIQYDRYNYSKCYYNVKESTPEVVKIVFKDKDNNLHYYTINTTKPTLKMNLQALASNTKSYVIDEESGLNKILDKEGITDINKRKEILKGINFLNITVQIKTLDNNNYLKIIDNTTGEEKKENEFNSYYRSLISSCISHFYNNNNKLNELISI